ncbi:hypothetical protein MCOL2_20883 [Listeria fleischmannii FSL S10-1203]|uniref:Uncharacterized protein n=1 Tax=Listeria fleischmannii FSL S10-1203 TaxID=1265822 RepID=W7CSP3_9LIST|nr:hypothetical protein MCOL2_20883 [Listeria fleischmannii FSL S10-1203]
MRAYECYLVLHAFTDGFGQRATARRSETENVFLNVSRFFLAHSFDVFILLNRIFALAKCPFFIFSNVYLLFK